MRVSVLGLGEAGSLFAADLVRAGADVVGFDPADVPTPDGVRRVDVATSAATDSTLILALTAASDAPVALEQILGFVPSGAVYADLSTGSPSLKRSLAAIAERHELQFADVALLGIVPGNGMRTPAITSGPGASAYRELLGAFGVTVGVVSGEPGDAAARKLLRSVFMKGMAAVVIEALRAGEAAGQAEWLWANITDEIAAAGPEMLTRLVAGTGVHAKRRLEEMLASAELLEEIGVEPVMTQATVQSLRTVLAHGLPAPETYGAGNSG